MFASVRNRSQVERYVTLCEAFGEGLGWKRDVSESCEIARKRVDVETRDDEVWSGG